MKNYQYKCCDCGKEFDEPGEDFNVGDWWGATCREYYQCCPYCGGDFDEIEDEEESEDGDEPE